MKEEEKISNTEVLYTYEVSAYRRRKLYIRIPVFIWITKCQALSFFDVLISHNLSLFAICCSHFYLGFCMSVWFEWVSESVRSYCRDEKCDQWLFFWEFWNASWANNLDRKELICLATVLIRCDVKLAHHPSYLFISWIRTHSCSGENFEFV
jgi:hypothetical protein